MESLRLDILEKQVAQFSDVFMKFVNSQMGRNESFSANFNTLEHLIILPRIREDYKKSWDNVCVSAIC